MLTIYKHDVASNGGNEAAYESWGLKTDCTTFSLRTYNEDIEIKSLRTFFRLTGSLLLVRLRDHISKLRIDMEPSNSF